MKAIQAEGRIDEVHLDKLGAHAMAAIRYTGEQILGQPATGYLEGSLTIHNLDLKPGQRVKVELHIL